MRARHSLGAALFVVAWSINPAYLAGCAGEDEEQAEFEFGEPEMLALLAAANETGSWTVTSALETYVVELQLQQRRDMPEASSAPGHTPSLFARSAHACGTRMRTFVRSASACATLYITNVPVEGTLTVLHQTDGKAELIEQLPVEGELSVRGLRLQSAIIELSGAGTTIELSSADAHSFDLSSFMGSDLGPNAIDVSWDEWQ